MSISRRTFVHAGLCGAVFACAGSGRALAAPASTRYVCPPCGCAADGRIFDGPGTCPACGMRLVVHPDDLPFEPQSLAPGAGAFRVRGGRGREDKAIIVHHYRPAALTPDSPILLVLPGAGRNGDDYRDSWIAAAEAHNILVAALAYSESDYDFAAYHMGGVIKNLRISNMPTGPDGRQPTNIHLRDEDFRFDINDRPETWLFNDFDRIFAILAGAVGSSRQLYDLFGHSAGGQILHRFALFQPSSRADRIVAANSGFYTLPDFSVPQPFGLAGTGLTESSLAAAFSRKLTLLLGELDNHPERGGIHLHTPLADSQGLDRLSRGRFFFEVARRQAERLGHALNWELEVVPGVAHDHVGMGRAAARLLYA
ncbi:heavy metal-binding domain-containing protein [Sphingosinicella sp. CPCC 101087]|uniref:heavy metal-binding domain-containing protein n=1 Tax=Sphingosinicella sp. CPCC 101087 TaxID=2497754 RepID=UPI00101DD540|nr:heavy metal-binding domain-containing protein [Sphingosinicella sp. CPCC 101087]